MSEAEYMKLVSKNTKHSEKIILAKKVVKRHADLFNRVSKTRSKIRLEEGRMPTKGKLLDVVNEIMRRRPPHDFDHYSFIEAAKILREHYTKVREKEKESEQA